MTKDDSTVHVLLRPIMSHDCTDVTEGNLGNTLVQETALNEAVEMDQDGTVINENQRGVEDNKKEQKNNWEIDDMQQERMKIQSDLMKLKEEMLTLKLERLKEEQNRMIRESGVPKVCIHFRILMNSICYRIIIHNS